MMVICLSMHPLSRATSLPHQFDGPRLGYEAGWLQTSGVGFEISTRTCVVAFGASVASYFDLKNSGE
jgi:hypothetical protein